LAKKAMSDKPKLGTAILNGLRLMCPNCGQGPLFRAYLKPFEACSHCSEPLGHIRADDGPAWLTILVTGHIVGPGLVMTQMRGLLSVGQGLALWLTIATVLMLSLLPRAKGVFIALLWQTGGPGSERDIPPLDQSATAEHKLP
jgi:uncharacterized protein (DUF983 family)